MEAERPLGGNSKEFLIAKATQSVLQLLTPAGRGRRFADV